MSGHRNASCFLLAIVVGLWGPSLVASVPHMLPESQFPSRYLLPVLATEQSTRPRLEQDNRTHRYTLRTTSRHVCVWTALGYVTIGAACCCVSIRVIAFVALAASVAFTLMRDGWRERHDDVSHRGPPSGSP